MSNACCLCRSLAQGQKGRSSQPWDTMVFESENFVAMPTRGAIIEGWMLVVPKKHYLCMGALGKLQIKELVRFKTLLVSTLQDCYGRMTIFEHGPAKPNLSVGCGVDHAHLHLVPISFNLIEKSEEALPENFRWHQINNMAQLRDYYIEQKSYLYVEQSVGKMYAGTHLDLGGQLFRKIIASEIGKADKYDWKVNAEEENIMATVDRLRGWSARNNFGQIPIKEYYNGKISVSSWVRS